MKTIDCRQLRQGVQSKLGDTPLAAIFTGGSAFGVLQLNKEASTRTVGVEAREGYVVCS